MECASPIPPGETALISVDGRPAVSPSSAGSRLRRLLVSSVGVLGAIINLNHPAHTVDWSFIHLSVANVVVIVLMLLVFVLAIVLPFPGAAHRRGGARVSVASPPSGEGSPAHPDTWTVRVRDAAVAALPPEKLLP